MYNALHRMGITLRLKPKFESELGSLLVLATIDKLLVFSLLPVTWVSFFKDTLEGAMRLVTASGLVPRTPSHLKRSFWVSSL